MKKILLVLVGAVFAIEMYAQTSNEEAEAIVNLLGIQKKEAVAKLVQISKEDSAVFWKLYDGYQQENIATAKDRIKLYEKTAFSYGNMTAHIADSLSKKYFDNRMAQEKSLEKYYAKIKSATNAVTAFEFYQAEVYILTLVRAQIMQQIPTYGEFKKATGKK